MTAETNSTQSVRRAWQIGFMAGSTAAFALALSPRVSVNIWVSTGMAAAVVVSAALAFRRRLFTAPIMGRAGDLVVGTGLGTAMAGLTWLLYPVALAWWPAISLEVKQLYAQLHAPPGPLLALPVLILVVAAEEIAWRGVSYELFRGHARLGWTAILLTVLYAIPHVASESGVLVGVALGCGLAWTLARAWRGSLAVVFSMHLTWSILVMLLFPVE